MLVMGVAFKTSDWSVGVTYVSIKKADTLGYLLLKTLTIEVVCILLLIF